MHNCDKGMVEKDDLLIEKRVKLASSVNADDSRMRRS
jgi:hypothetical protein